jgi:hypothetical protein
MAIRHHVALVTAARKELGVRPSEETLQWVARFAQVYASGNRAIPVTTRPFLVLLLFLRDNEEAREAFMGAYNLRAPIIDLLNLVVDLYEK